MVVIDDGLVGGGFVLDGGDGSGGVGSVGCRDGRDIVVMCWENGGVGSVGCGDGSRDDNAAGWELNSKALAIVEDQSCQL
ncbi:hypothetical protein L1049_016869 [Liquidambar formosana]|uniref:Uncharacterized protein n=1 Tax=Liquidambar formosana TaxID=63359 RepID=A0AAP0X736_LIQFO